MATNLKIEESSIEFCVVKDSIINYIGEDTDTVKEFQEKDGILLAY